MADVKISGLSSAAALDGTELIPLVQGGTTLQSTTGAIAGLVTFPSLPLSIANGGTSQSNAQAAINLLTNIAGGSNGDVFQLLAGNAQWAPLTIPPAGVTSLNSLTGDLIIHVNGSSVPSDATNAFAYSNNSGFLDNLPGWSLDPASFFSNVALNYAPNNLAAGPFAHAWQTNIAPLQNSPNDSIRLHSFNLNLDSSATGFQFGTNGQAGELLGGGYNYGGNGASFGTLRNINLFSSLGDGVNPGSFKQMVASAHSYNIAANITLDGTLQGYDFNANVNAGAITTSNFNVLWLTDFSQYPVNVYGYQGVVCQPTIGTIKNNHNFSGGNVNPNITTMEGNAGVFGWQLGGTVTNLGTGGLQGFYLNPTIGTIPATAQVIGYGMFPQITTAAAGSNLHGVNISPTITTLHGTWEGSFQTFPQIGVGSDGNVSLFTGGMGSVHTTGQTSVMNLNGQTADGNQSQFAADGIRTNLGGQLIASSSGGVSGQHIIFTSFVLPAATAITNTDFLINIFSPDIDMGAVTSTCAAGPNIGRNGMVGFAGQIHGHGQMDALSALIAGGIFLDDFTLGEWRNVDGIMINAGFAGNVTNATCFYHEIQGAGPFATNHWGVKIVTDMDNYFTKLSIGTTSKKNAAGNSLEIETPGLLALTTAGNGLAVKEGSNAKMGTATLALGTATVSTTAVTANSRIFLTNQAASGGGPGELTIANVIPGTSFDINSTVGGDTSVIAWFIVEAL